MGILNKTKVYLAGNLEFTSDAESWRDILTKQLKKEFNITSLDPTKTFLVCQTPETGETHQLIKDLRHKREFDQIKSTIKEFIKNDLRAVDLVDFLIVKLEPNNPTWGTPHEIVVASLQKKPILMIIDDIRTMPIWLIGLVNMDFVFETKEDMFSYLRRVDKGEEKLNGKYWKLLQPNLR